MHSKSEVNKVLMTTEIITKPRRNNYCIILHDWTPY